MLPILATLITFCSDAPHGDGKWLYRIIDGHRCFFQDDSLSRGRKKPKEELKWPVYDPPESDFDLRWKGER